MKNNKNYCKFVSQVKSSQVKSSQVKSSAKIISLIALFILLFSISCKSKQNPTPKYSELVGTWKFGDFIFTIDSSGNLNLNCGVNKYINTHCNYSGKLADDFEYPYTIELTFTISSHASITSCPKSKDSLFLEGVSKLEQSKTGRFTFSDASTCTPYIETIRAAGNVIDWVRPIGGVIFKKQ